MIFKRREQKRHDKGQNRQVKKAKRFKLFVLILMLLLVPAVITEIPEDKLITEEKLIVKETVVAEDKLIYEETVVVEELHFNIANISEYSDMAYAVVNNNNPFFTDTDITNATSSYESYANLDDLGRCGVCIASVGKDIMPTEERGLIGSVKPSGWQTVKYNGIVDGNYLYNRCHLLSYQLTGENANKNNLITGTRYMNVNGMLPFENLVAAYVKETDNHVLYRVTPIFESNNLVASGVLMEARSVEDNGEGVLFNVYVYNVQPGVSIDYETGNSELDKAILALQETVKEDEELIIQPTDNNSNSTSLYVINNNTKKFHYPTCLSVNDIKDNNRQDYNGNRDNLISLGYAPCKRCNP